VRAEEVGNTQQCGDRGERVGRGDDGQIDRRGGNYFGSQPKINCILCCEEGMARQMFVR
jgi:hypothetical protein